MSRVQEWPHASSVEDVAPAWHVDGLQDDPCDCSIQAVKTASDSAAQSCTTEAIDAAAKELMRLLMS